MYVGLCFVPHLYEYIVDYRRGMNWIIVFIDHLYTQLSATSNYSALADFHTLQITKHEVYSNL
jgi:hypothetical protein